jgi:hypothetical protein
VAFISTFQLNGSRDERAGAGEPYATGHLVLRVVVVFHVVYSLMSGIGFECLPRDVLRLLFSTSYLDLCTIVSCKSTCKLFAGLMDLERLNCNVRDFPTLAATLGYLKLLQWAWAAGCPCVRDLGICREAAKGGHLQLL